MDSTIRYSMPKILTFLRVSPRLFPGCSNIYPLFLTYLVFPKGVSPYFPTFPTFSPRFNHLEMEDWDERHCDGETPVFWRKNFQNALAEENPQKLAMAAMSI